jgi:hypothetical protein
VKKDRWDPPSDAELLRDVAKGIEDYVLLGIDIPRAAQLLRALADKLPVDDRR